MNLINWFYLCFVALCSYVSVKAGGHGGHHHVKFIIKYPVIIKKHTHTIYKTIHHGHGGGGGGGGHDGHSHGGVPFKLDEGWH